MYSFPDLEPVYFSMYISYIFQYLRSDLVYPVRSGNILSSGYQSYSLQWCPYIGWMHHSVIAGLTIVDILVGGAGPQLSWPLDCDSYIGFGPTRGQGKYHHDLLCIQGCWVMLLLAHWRTEPGPHTAVYLAQGESRLVLARTWKQPRCPSADEWIRKLWYINTREYYSAFKKNTFESVLMRWMKLEPIIQSEVSQKEKHQYSIRMHIYGI